MYKDVINYKLAEGVTLEHLFEVGKKVHEERMSKQKGFIKWEIHVDEDGEYFDLVYRESKAAADKANEEMANVPSSEARFACYDMTSINSKGLTCMKEF